MRGRRPARALGVGGRTLDRRPLRFAFLTSRHRMCHDAAMESGEWHRTDEVSLGDRLGPNRFAPAARHWRHYARTHGQRAAGAALIVTFVLVLASQWFPWADIHPDRGSGADLKVGIDNAMTTMVLTYYLMWVIALALAGATVFAPARARRALFGASMGSIAALFISIVPLLRHPKGLVNQIGDLLSPTGATTLVVTRQPGMFCAVAALAVLAAGMVLAVGGDVLPAASPGAAADESTPVATTPRTAAMDAAASDGRHSVGNAMPTSPQPAQAGYPALTVEGVEALPDAPVAARAPQAEQDHSPFVRPLGNDQYRR